MTPTPTQTANFAHIIPLWWWQGAVFFVSLLAYWDEFYTLHNDYRSQQGLGELHVDVNIEEILQRAGFVTGHGHSQANNLHSK